MAQATGLVIVKEMQYRENSEEQWSNKYWLTGTPPSNATDWQLLFNQVVTLEQEVYTGQTKVVAGIGYDDDSDGAHAVWSVDMEATSGAIPGRLQAVLGIEFAGDQAGMVWIRTGRKNSRGKWVYLRKYFHGGLMDNADTDSLAPECETAYSTFIGHLHGGTGGLLGRQLRSQSQTEVLEEHGVSPWVTTRTLKRRGKRPLKAPTHGLASPTTGSRESSSLT